MPMCLALLGVAAPDGRNEFDPEFVNDRTLRNGRIPPVRTS